MAARIVGYKGLPRAPGLVGAALVHTYRTLTACPLQDAVTRLRATRKGEPLPLPPDLGEAALEALQAAGAIIEKGNPCSCCGGTGWVPESENHVG